MTSEEKRAFRIDGSDNIYLVRPELLSDNSWHKIMAGFNYYGYGMPDTETTKKVYTDLCHEFAPGQGYRLRKDQAEAVRRIWSRSYLSTKTGTPAAVLKRAYEEFGETKIFSLAGYLTTDGRLLDFSDGQAIRTLDHRQIRSVLDAPYDTGYSDGMVYFMNLGNIRMLENGIDIAVCPNQPQKDQLYDFFSLRKGDIYVDYSNHEGKNVGTSFYHAKTHPARILGDIDTYFSTYEVPEGNNTYF